MCVYSIGVNCDTWVPAAGVLVSLLLLPGLQGGGGGGRQGKDPREDRPRYRHLPEHEQDQEDQDQDQDQDHSQSFPGLTDDDSEVSSLPSPPGDQQASASGQ